MKLTFTGTGSAFTVGHNNYQSNMFLETQGERLMIDCGTDARLALHELGLSYRDIGSVYISHLHADHTGGLEWLAFSRKFDPNCLKPHLYIQEKLADILWEKVLSGGLSSLQGIRPDLSLYFDMHPLKENGVFEWQHTRFQLVRTIHIMTEFETTPSYGLIFSVPPLTIFITTDTQFRPDHYLPFYTKADLIFHDCETTPFESGVHSHFNQLSTLPDKIKAKMWLYHYSEETPLPDAKTAGFRGFVKKGQCFDFSDPKSYG